MNLQVEDFKQWMEKTYEILKEKRDYLTELDQVIGDGDHGINMERGFRAVVEKLNENDYADLEALVKDLAMTIISKVGGAAGPLYGTAFLRMASAFKDKKEVDLTSFVTGLEAALEGIQARGKASLGEKTLVDVWAPVLESLRQAASFDAKAIEETAKTAANQTKDLLATKGRAAYFKENSIGHIDPGAMSSYYLFSALADIIRGKLK